MLVHGTYEKARLYIETHSPHAPSFVSNRFPCITISREAGSGSGIVSAELLNFFDKQKFKITGAPDWTVFDRNLIYKILEDHHLPAYLQKSLEENKYSSVTSIFTELFTGQPSAWALMAKELQTILHLAAIGNVVIIGRGANFITSKNKNCFHVRLVAPVEQRVKRVMDLHNISAKEAEACIKRDDEGRKKFVLSHFGQNVEDPGSYHMVLNTGIVPYSEAAKIIGRAVAKRFRQLYSQKRPEEQPV